MIWVLAILREAEEENGNNADGLIDVVLLSIYFCLLASFFCIAMGLCNSSFPYTYIYIYICIYLSIYLSIYLFINLSLLSVIIPRSLMGDLEDESTVLHWLLELLCAEPLFCVHVSSASALLPVQSVSDDVNSTSGSSASTALPIMYVLMNLGFSIYVSV